MDQKALDNKIESQEFSSKSWVQMVNEVSTGSIFSYIYSSNRGFLVGFWRIHCNNAIDAKLMELTHI